MNDNLTFKWKESNEPKEESTPKGTEKKHSTFQEYVKDQMQKKHMSQLRLSTASHLSEATVSRMLRNQNKTGEAPFRLTEEIVVAVACALRVGESEWEEMRKLAFPEREYWRKALQDGKDVSDLNDELMEHHLPIVGTR